MRKLAVLTLALLSLQAAWAAVLPVGVVVRAQPAPYRGDWSADSRNTWRDDDGEPRVQFNLRSNAGDSRWGFGVRLRDLVGLPASALSSTANDIQFSFTREAGGFRFSGSFDQGRGNGTYVFTPDQSFIANMGAVGYRNLSTDDLVRLAVIDVTVVHVRGLAQAGYPSLSLDDVVRTRIHRVTPANIKALQDAGIRGQSVEDLIRLRIHKVTPDYIKGMREVGFQAVSEDQLVRMKIHKVDAQFVRHAREDGLTVQTPGEAIDLAIHGPRWRKRQ